MQAENNHESRVERSERLITEANRLSEEIERHLSRNRGAEPKDGAGSLNRD